MGLISYLGACSFLCSILSLANGTPYIDKEVEGAKSWLRRVLPGLESRPNPRGDAFLKEFGRVIRIIEANATIRGWKRLPRRGRRFESFDSFSCPTPPSSSVPTSVHKLRPGDVKVVGAIGDSLTAGNGIDAKTLLGLLLQYRGHTFSMGGADFGSHVTLPNLLRINNKKLRGYSTGIGTATSYRAGFNSAEPGSVASDMPQQANNLVAKMKASSSVDIANDWKIVTIFIGGNDVCDFCKDKTKHSPEAYRRNVEEAIDIIQANLPRTFVNLIETLDVSLIHELKHGAKVCDLLLSYFLCSCAANADTEEKKMEVLAFQRGYQRAVRDIAMSGKYDTKDDFTVVYQPFFRDSAPDRTPDGKYDFDLFAPDCFHFSRLGHAYAGKALWNNMMQPVGQKDTKWNPNAAYLCPSEARPYFATVKNSS